MLLLLRPYLYLINTGGVLPHYWQLYKDTEENLGEKDADNKQITRPFSLSQCIWWHSHTSCRYRFSTGAAEASTRLSALGLIWFLCPGMAPESWSWPAAGMSSLKCVLCADTCFSHCLSSFPLHLSQLLMSVIAHPILLNSLWYFIL